MIGIYKIKNNVNGKFYIGQSIDVEKRWKRHIWELNNCRHENRHLNNSWSKYGQSNFSFQILEECYKDDINSRELFYINELKPQYNIKGGGDSVHTISDETRAIMSKNRKGKPGNNLGKKWTDEHKNKISLRLKGTRVGEKNTMFGKKLSDETKAKMSKSLKGKLSGDKHPLFGKSSPNRKEIICTNDNKKFSCVRDAGLFYGINPKFISAVCSGKRKTTKGLAFIYAERG